MKEFNPIDKVSELTEMFLAYNPIIQKNTEEGYERLDENSVCLELQNPTGGERITIDCDCYEFIVCFSCYHCHYSPEEYEYSRMCEQIFDLLNNKCCVAAIFYGSEKKLMSSMIIEKEKISLPIEEIFPFDFKTEIYAQKLRTNGGEARFVFWDSNFNKIIKI